MISTFRAGGPVGVMVIIVLCIVIGQGVFHGPKMVAARSPAYRRLNHGYVTFCVALGTLTFMNHGYAARLPALEIGPPLPPVFKLPYIGSFGVVREAIPLVLVVTIAATVAAFLMYSKRERAVQNRRNLAR